MLSWYLHASDFDSVVLVQNVMMAKEIYSPELQAAIAEFLRPTDTAYGMDFFKQVLVSGDFQRQFGTLNFGGLESIFRRNNFKTYFLAVPLVMVSSRMPEVLAIHPDEAPKLYNASSKAYPEIVEQSQKVNYVAFANPSRTAVEAAAADWGFQYNAIANLIDLSDSGVMVPKPGSQLARQFKGFMGSN